MRDEMTISLIGPLPRSHSPAWLVKSLSFNDTNSSFFGLSDLVPDLRRFLVILRLHGPLQFFSQSPDIHHLLLGPRRRSARPGPRRHLSRVMRRSLVRPLEQRR